MKNAALSCIALMAMAGCAPKPRNRPGKDAPNTEFTVRIMLLTPAKSALCEGDTPECILANIKTRAKFLESMKKGFQEIAGATNLSSADQETLEAARKTYAEERKVLIDNLKKLEAWTRLE